MHKHWRTGGLAISSALALAAAACSDETKPAQIDPATEEPVRMESGLYEISVTQTFKKASGTKTAPKPICVGLHEISSFPHKLAEEHFVSQRGCRTSRFPREGNKVSGEITCGVDQRMGEGVTRFVYSGVVARDRFSIEGNMIIDATVHQGAGAEISDEALNRALRRVEQVKTSIRGKRLSMC